MHHQVLESVLKNPDLPHEAIAVSVWGCVCVGGEGLLLLLLMLRDAPPALSHPPSPSHPTPPPRR